MTPFARFIKRAIEKSLGTFAEGPEPPFRLKQLVVEFVNANPRLTRAQVVEFGVRLVDSVYRAGYQRGWERTVRDPDVEWRRLPPELVADALDPDWRWRPALGDELANPADFVEDELPAGVIDLSRHLSNPPDE